MRLNSSKKYRIKTKKKSSLPLAGLQNARFYIMQVLWSTGYKPRRLRIRNGPFSFAEIHVVNPTHKKHIGVELLWQT